jgi:putative tryptophan/tyrosine transport system substrate-binding protein
MKTINNKLLLLIYLVLILLSLSCQKSSKLFTIGIVQISDSQALNEGREGVIETLKLEGFIDGQNIKIDYKNAQGDVAAVPQILQSFKMENVDLILTISTPCMVAAAQQIKNIPVVFTIAFGPEQMGIKEIPSNLTGLYDPLDMAAFLKMIRRSMPNVKCIGIPYGSSEPNATFAAGKIVEECKKENLDYVQMAFTSSNDVMQVCEALAQKNIDAFASSADNTIFQALESVLKVANKYKKPVFLTEPNLTEKGVTAGLGVDYKDWGRESGKMIAQIIRGKKVSEIPIQALKNYKLKLNLKAAKTQGFEFPPDLIQEANVVIK